MVLGTDRRPGAGSSARSTSPAAATGLGGIGDAFGNLIDVFDPGQARAAREIKRRATPAR